MNIKRGVRRIDTISPKLFTATLEIVLRRFNRENNGAKTDGEFLKNLCFAEATQGSNFVKKSTCPTDKWITKTTCP